MNPIRLNLLICLGGTIIWVFTFAFFVIRITVQKKMMEKLGQTVEKIKAGYVGTIIVCFLVCLLPYLILFKPYITAVLEGCGILGTWSLMKERLEKIEQKNN